MKRTNLRTYVPLATSWEVINQKRSLQGMFTQQCPLRIRSHMNRCPGAQRRRKQSDMNKLIVKRIYCHLLSFSKTLQYKKLEWIENGWNTEKVTNVLQTNTPKITKFSSDKMLHIFKWFNPLNCLPKKKWSIHFTWSK